MGTPVKNQRNRLGKSQYTPRYRNMSIFIFLYTKLSKNIALQVQKQGFLLSSFGLCGFSHLLACLPDLVGTSPGWS
jgi:hypothetical protein